MTQENSPVPVSKAARWTGFGLAVPPVALLLFSAVMKLVQPAGMGMTEGMTHLGVPMSLAFGIGVLEVICTVIYLIPRTSILGCVLLTGYLGGATMTHLRVGDPYFMMPLLGVLLWGSLFLREPRLRALLPLRR